jgi:DNA topoisomerase-2
MASSSASLSSKSSEKIIKKVIKPTKETTTSKGDMSIKDISNNELAQTYQMKTDKQHVLDAPDTYTGSMDITDYETYVFNDETSTIIPKQIQIIPGLYKLFDEGVVNCRDHCVRMAQAQQLGQAQALDIIPVTYIDVSISTTDGIITMTNDGNGIDVEKHPEHNIWIPELIFGHLRTSTNYDKSQKKIVGGKNGFGFKLVLIWSTWGRIETIDHKRGLKYVQEFENNLDIIKPPTITKCTTKKPYTKVSFKPDYKRLNLPSGLSFDMLALFKRRVYDIAAITDKTIKVKYNGETIPVKHFQQYVDLYIGSKTDTQRLYEEANERWEYVVCLAPKGEFTQVSFVNGIYTGKGGKHVDYIINQIVRKVSAVIKQKKKMDVKPATIKEQLSLFLRCDIENPSFDSQTKDYMNTPITSFGSACDVSDKFIENIIKKLGVMDAACALTEVKENKAAKKTDGVKSKSIRGIPKLIDANWAGTDKSEKTIIIFCEGDSAKAGIVSGLSTEDRNIIGVYPMRGKMFNVRGEQKKRIYENKEVNEIKQILGLETGKVYTKESAKKSLRYGKVIFMTDQDLDGSHIKGLCINLFDSEWESLLDIPGFLGFMNTPIIKANKGTGTSAGTLAFYNEGEYNKWKESTTETDMKKWTIKYYKGLGTSTAKEFKEYFAHKKLVEFTSSGQESKDAIDMAFNKKRAQDRKDWLIAYDRTLYLDTNRAEVKYEDFIKEELIHFSKYDCDRSIPNMIDGQKTSLRKILYTCFKRDLTKSIKVAQLSGSVSELSCYHHGEQSLNGAIVGMAQKFVGANNINLLVPNGQFGTRLQGGEDSASERYIFTNLNPMTRFIFPEADDSILNYLNDDGTLVEPVHYVPIIPMLLVNGSKGIGTGFSSEFLCYNPLTIIDAVKNKLKTPLLEESSLNLVEPLVKLEPYYEGFKGKIIELSENKYLIKGVYEIVNEKQVRVTELPVGLWTDDYKAYIEDLIIKGETQIKDYMDMSTDTKVDITITFASSAIVNELETTIQTDYPSCNALEKLLKLYTTKSTTNMHAFDENEKLVKFAKVEDVITHFVDVRLRYYVERKKHKIVELEKITRKLSNIARFITEMLEDKIDLRRKKSVEVNTILKERGYDTSENSEGTNNENGSYNYLVKLPMDSVTEENVAKKIKERDEKIQELELLKATSEQQLWLNELNILREKYVEYKKNTETEESGETIKIVKKKKLVVVKK